MACAATTTVVGVEGASHNALKVAKSRVRVSRYCDFKQVLAVHGTVLRAVERLIEEVAETDTTQVSRLL